MAFYQGEDFIGDPKSSYAKSGGDLGERCNFLVQKDSSFIYGYINSGGGGSLDRLGGDEKAKFVDGVTVIFVELQTGLLSGYYRNARVYRNLKRHPDGHLENRKLFRCRVKAEDAYLISAPDRKPAFKKSLIGASQFRYGNDEDWWVRDFEELLNTDSDSRQQEKKRFKTVKKLERTSAARSIALTEFGYVCGCCGLTGRNDNVREAIFEVHHKKPFKRGVEQIRDLKLEDLIVLCANCHKSIHKMPDLGDVDALRSYLKEFQS